MKTLLPAMTLLLGLILAGAPAGAQKYQRHSADQGDIGYEPADPSAPAVTAGNLLENERFWPYRVSLTEAYQPAGRSEPLPAGARGLLVRVQPGGDVLRVDFTRDGKHEVPVGVTDLVARANEVRLGTRDKVAPNLLYAIGPRIVDTLAYELGYFDFRALLERPGFLTVYADPKAPGFAELAASLTPLRDRHDVLTVLLPQGRHPDPDTRATLRELNWPVPFVLGTMAEGYTLSRLDPGSPLPFVMLQTPDGRVQYQGAWSPDRVPELAAALERHYGATPVTASGEVR